MPFTPAQVVSTRPIVDTLLPVAVFAMHSTNFFPTAAGGGVTRVGRFRTMFAGVVYLALTILLVGSCGAASTVSDASVSTVEPTIEGSTTDLEELHAFAKLYGYVRYFHPSDEAAAADWEAIAVE